MKEVLLCIRIFRKKSHFTAYRAFVKRKVTNIILTWLGVKGDARDPTGDPMLLKPVGDFWLVSLLGWESLSSSSASDDAETWC